MPRAFNDFKARAGDKRGRFLDQSDGRGAVLVADQAQGRGLDPSGIGSEVGALQSPAGGKIALARRSREHGAHTGELGGSPRSELSGEPPFEDGIGQGFDAAALDLSDSLVPDVVGSDFRRRVAKHERRDAIRILTIELLRDQAADGESDNRRAPDADFIEKRRKVARIVGHVVRVRAGFGKPVAALVMKNDAEIGCEDLGDVVPDAEVSAERVDKDKRRPVPAPLVASVDDEAVGLHEFHGAGFSGGLRRAARKKVHQYQMRASGAPKSTMASRPGIGVAGMTSIPAAAVAPTR